MNTITEIQPERIPEQPESAHKTSPLKAFLVLATFAVGPSGDTFVSVVPQPVSSAGQ